ncbi:DUF6129 family protein [Stutzerimonas tarimensis]|uniref:DUF6129 family protein n=1 Tax=Stutzerimonas tarimensis TaxID=1507735 RepID=A0ABV7T7R8_9GAMM
MINQAQLDEVIRTVEQASLDETLLTRLRAAYPGVHFNTCMDDDVSVNAKPYAERAGFNVYLVNSANHCSTLTNDPDIASGVVLAEIIED